jgi:DNA-binding transcriptional regulator YbjK
MTAFFDSLDEMVTKCFAGNHKATMAATDTFVMDIEDTQDKLDIAPNKPSKWPLGMLANSFRQLYSLLSNQK